MVVMHIYRLPEGPERYPPPYEYIQDALCCPDILTLPPATIVFIMADSLYAPHVYVMQAPELSIRREKTEQRWCVKQKK